MFNFKNIQSILLATLLSAGTISTNAMAGPSSQHVGAASTHSAHASAHVGAAAVKGVSAVAAAPPIAVGSVGLASAAAGSALHEFANQPLPVGHEIVHTAPTTPSPADQMAKPQSGKD